MTFTVEEIARLEKFLAKAMEHGCYPTEEDAYKAGLRLLYKDHPKKNSLDSFFDQIIDFPSSQHKDILYAGLQLLYKREIQALKDFQALDPNQGAAAPVVNGKKYIQIKVLDVRQLEPARIPNGENYIYPCNYLSYMVIQLPSGDIETVTITADLYDVLFDEMKP